MGNFAPVKEEHEAYYICNKDITGKIPTDISGVYLRNGPNPKYIPANGRQHWFDGDSMIHAMRIKNGAPSMIFKIYFDVSLCISIFLKFKIKKV